MFVNMIPTNPVPYLKRRLPVTVTWLPYKLVRRGFVNPHSDDKSKRQTTRRPQKTQQWIRQVQQNGTLVGINGSNPARPNLPVPRTWVLPFSSRIYTKDDTTPPIKAYNMVRPTVFWVASRHSTAKAVAMPSQAAVAGQIQVGKAGHSLRMTELRNKYLLTAEGQYSSKMARWGTVRVFKKAPICVVGQHNVTAGIIDAAHFGRSRFVLLPITACRVSCRVSFSGKHLRSEKRR